MRDNDLERSVSVISDEITITGTVTSSGNLIMSNIVDPSINFVPPPEEAFVRSLEGKPIRSEYWWLGLFVVLLKRHQPR